MKDPIVELNVARNFIRIDGKEAFDVVPYQKGTLDWTSEAEVLMNNEESLFSCLLFRTKTGRCSRLFQFSPAAAG